MAAFTTMAILGLTALASGMAAKKIADGKKNPDQDTMTGDPNGPHAKLGDPPVAPPAPPPTVAQTSAQGQRAAADAAARARKRAAAGATLLDKPLNAQTPAKAKIQPKTLIGY